MPRTGSGSNTFAETLKRAREARGWSQSEFARQLSKKLGETVSPGTANRWERADEARGFTPPRYRIAACADLLGVGIETLLIDTPEERTPSVRSAAKNLRTIPLVGVAAAGEAMAKLTEAKDIPWFSFSEDFLQPMFRGRMDDERAILMRVEGDSMEGDLPHGSLVFIDRGPNGEGLTDVNDEDIYMVQPPDEEGLTLKRVSIQGRGESKIMMLMPSGLALNRYRVKPYSLAKDTGLTIQSVVRGRVVGRFEYVGRSRPTAK